MEQTYNKTNIFFSVLCIAFLIYSTQFFHYKFWNPAIAVRFSYFIYAFLFLWFYKSKNAWNNSFALTNIVKALIFFSLPCLFSKTLIAGESLVDEREYFMGIVTFFFYFIFCSKEINERTIINILTTSGILIFAIQVLQQMSPSSAVFGVYNPDIMEWQVDDVAEIRNGLYRFRLGSYMISVFCFYYYWQRLLDKFNMINLLFFGMFAVSVYLYLTRQIMFACIITILLSSFFTKDSRVKVWMLLLGGIVLFVLYQYSSVLFGDLFEQTQDENTRDNIRILSLGFYWEQIADDFICSIIGHGHISELNVWKSLYGFYTSDIGIIGEWFLYGLGWCILYLFTLYLLLIKYAKLLPLYVKLFVFGTSINAIMIFPYTSPYAYFVWISILYISSIYIAERKDLIVNTELRSL